MLYSFKGGADGANPSAGVIQDAAGNLYGTTTNGGTSSLGAVYKLEKTGDITVLHSFAGGADGANPDAGVILDTAGNLYGTTTGSNSCSNRYPNRFFCGTVFKLDAAGNFSALHRFGYFDGAWPYAALVRDGVGNLYGTTETGGADSNGTLFRLSATGSFSVLRSFTGGTDGAFPQGRLTQDAAGNLFGTARLGGASGFGAVFKLTP